MRTNGPNTLFLHDGQNNEARNSNETKHSNEVTDARTPDASEIGSVPEALTEAPARCSEPDRPIPIPPSIVTSVAKPIVPQRSGRDWRSSTAFLHPAMGPMPEEGVSDDSAMPADPVGQAPPVAPDEPAERSPDPVATSDEKDDTDVSEGANADGNAPETLDEIAKAIGGKVKHLIEEKIEIGRLLAKALNLLGTEGAYAAWLQKWRFEVRTAFNYRVLHEHYAEHVDRVAHVNQTELLALAKPAVAELRAEFLAADEPWTTEEIRERLRQLRANRTRTDPTFEDATEADIAITLQRRLGRSFGAFAERVRMLDPDALQREMLALMDEQGRADGRVE